MAHAAVVPGSDEAARILSPHRPAAGTREKRIGYLLLAPAVILVFGVLAYPLVWHFWLSLTDFAMLQTSARFVGLGNYAAIVRDPEFWRATADTLGYLVLTAVLKMAVGIGMALLLARPFPGRPIVFIAAFLPWAYPGGLGAVAWWWFFTPALHTAYSETMGNLRYFIERPLGVGAWGFLSLVAFNVWRGGSFVGIFLLAAINGIPQDLFDYASLEVKPGWRKFWLVTVPLLRPFLALATFLSLTAAVVDLGNVWEVSGFRDVYPIVWTQAFHLAIIGGQWGKAAAMSLILMPVLGLILFLCYSVFDPLEEEGT
ncbi:MAG TPA: sugar ABC transporter permease [bacterium]|nr:sugar ABC transporter permease [bacterium]